MTKAPSALLFIGNGCPHCPTVLDGLARLVKNGALSRLEVVNANAEPELAERHMVRSVPWMRIGPFELTGAFSASELADWVERANTGEGCAAYYAHLLESNRLREVVTRIGNAPSTLNDMLDLLMDEDVSIGTRIGISAVIESLDGSPVLTAALPQIEQLTLSESAQTRADACHFLGICGARSSIPVVRRLLDDEQPDVRDIAMETLAMLGEGT